MKRGWRYFKDPDNHFQLALYTLTLIFIVSFVKGNECWCSAHWQWQIGAFAVFLSWINFILILKYIPYTAVPINMFVSICVKFLKMIFLPLLLVLAFGIPFYMVFSTEVSCLGCAMVHILIWLLIVGMKSTALYWQLYTVFSLIRYKFQSYLSTEIWKPDSIHVSQSSYSQDLRSACWRVRF